MCGIVIDRSLPGFLSELYSIVRVLIPVILIIFGIIDLFKGLISGDSKEGKNKSSMFIKRIIYALLIFFMVPIIKFIVNVLDKSEAVNGNELNACIECFTLNEKCNYSKDLPVYDNSNTENTGENRNEFNNNTSIENETLDNTIIENEDTEIDTSLIIENNDIG